jgi:Leucine-rich repeat (LRR) protein
LEHLTKLKKLYLYANEIERIENLNTLTSLEVLWLNENQIYSLEVGVISSLQANIFSNIMYFLMLSYTYDMTFFVKGLSALQELTELNMAENKISLIG